MLFAGLLDWHSPSLPTSESISGARCIAQGQIHIKAIVEPGGLVRGIRALELDELRPWQMRGAREPGGGAAVQMGYEKIRIQTRSDAVLPVFSTWGFRAIVQQAEVAFGSSSNLIGNRGEA